MQKINFQWIGVFFILLQFTMGVSGAAEVNSYKTFNGKIYDRHLKTLSYLDESNPKIIVLFSGTPGMGKTEIAKKLEEQLHGIRISSDEVRYIMKKDKIKDEKLLNDYLLWSLKRLSKDTPNHLFIMDRSIDRTYDHYVNFAKNFGYELFLVRINVDKNVVEERIKQRGANVNTLLYRLNDRWDEYVNSTDKYPADFAFDNNGDQTKPLAELITLIKQKIQAPGLLGQIKPGTQTYNEIRKNIVDDFPTSPEMQEIIPGLYLGNEAAANHLPPTFTNVLCFRTELIKPVSNEIIWKGLALPDTNNTHLLPHLQECFDFIDSSKGDVLVHCKYGRSRSPAVVIGYLMKKFDVPFDKAYRFVRQKRPTIEPNSGFIAELKIYEKMLRDQKDKK